MATHLVLGPLGRQDLPEERRVAIALLLKGFQNRFQRRRHSECFVHAGVGADQRCGSLGVGAGHCDGGRAEGSAESSQTGQEKTAKPNQELRRLKIRSRIKASEALPVLSIIWGHLGGVRFPRKPPNVLARSSESEPCNCHLPWLPPYERTSIEAGGMCMPYSCLENWEGFGCHTRSNWTAGGRV
jgi:hypothetical protein